MRSQFCVFKRSQEAEHYRQIHFSLDATSCWHPCETWLTSLSWSPLCTFCFVTCQGLVLKSDKSWQQPGCLINLISQGGFQLEKGIYLSSDRQSRLLQVYQKSNHLAKASLCHLRQNDSRQEIRSALHVKGMHKVPAPFVCVSHICTSLIAQVGRSWCNSSLILHCKTGSMQKQNTLEKFWISTCQKELVHEESWRSRRDLMS